MDIECDDIDNGTNVPCEWSIPFSTTYDMLWDGEWDTSIYKCVAHFTSLNDATEFISNLPFKWWLDVSAV